MINLPPPGPLRSAIKQPGTSPARHLLLLLLIYLLPALPGQAQERLHNVRIRAVDSTQLEIRYDLVSVRPGDSVYIEIRSRLRGLLLVSAALIRGDIGTRISAGLDRRILWDALANGYPLDEEVQAKVFVRTNTGPVEEKRLRPTVVIRQPPATTAPVAETTPAKVTPVEPVAVAPAKPTEPVPVPAAPTSKRSRKRTATVVLADTSQARKALPALAGAPLPVQSPVVQPAGPGLPSQADSVPPRRARYAGPAWALLSVVAPGIGNIFVQTPKSKVGFRPLLTVATYGLVAYGLTERQKSQDEYAIYQEQKNLAAGEPYYQTANGHYHRYFLATRGALVLAAADVILTLLKGQRNGKEARLLPGLTLRPGMQAGQPTAVMHYSF